MKSLCIRAIGVMIFGFSSTLHSQTMNERLQANNEVYIEPSDFMPEGEMYRDFDSYYEFAYGNEYWNGFKRLLKSQIIWLIVPFAYIIMKKTVFKKSARNDLIDQ